MSQVTLVDITPVFMVIGMLVGMILTAIIIWSYALVKKKNKIIAELLDKKYPGSGQHFLKLNELKNTLEVD